MYKFLEETLPFIPYCANRRKILAKLESMKDSTDLSSYHTLSKEEVLNYIKKEHERADLIDSKTVKFTLTLAIVSVIISSTSTFVSKELPYGSLATILLVLSVAYMLIGVLISLGALGTLPKYGYGASFAVKAKIDNRFMYFALEAQEKINNLRHLRNEAAYQCVRNGFYLIIASYLLILISYIWSALGW